MNLYPWGDSLPYNSLAARFKEQYGGRIQKVSLRGNFTCPNRDGRLGTGGCTFCNNDSFVPSYTRGSADLHRQIDDGLLYLDKLYRRARFFVAYFQAYTNTYGDFEQIRQTYDYVLTHPRIKGLVIGTRPDCVDEKILDYFADLKRKGYFVQIEYGIESCDDRILRSVNRGHDFAAAEKAVRWSAERGIHTGAHFMFGFAGDTRESMLSQAGPINRLPLTSVKFHQLQIVKGTAMALQYALRPEEFPLFEEEEYIDFVIDLVGRLRPGLCIERFASEVPPALRIAPIWSGRRIPQLQQAIIRRMIERNVYQGIYYRSASADSPDR